MSSATPNQTTNRVILSNGRTEVRFETDRDGETTVTRNCVKRPIGRKAARNQMMKLLSPEGGYKVVAAA